MTHGINLKPKTRNQTPKRQDQRTQQKLAKYPPVLSKREVDELQLYNPSAEKPDSRAYTEYILEKIIEQSQAKWDATETATAETEDQYSELFEKYEKYKASPTTPGKLTQHRGRTPRTDTRNTGEKRTRRKNQMRSKSRVYQDNQRGKGNRLPHQENQNHGTRKHRNQNLDQRITATASGRPNLNQLPDPKKLR